MINQKFRKITYKYYTFDVINFIDVGEQFIEHFNHIASIVQSELKSKIDFFKDLRAHMNCQQPNVYIQISFCFVAYELNAFLI